VYVAFSRDEETMGFAFPKEERAALVAAEPTKFVMPPPSDLRFNWVVVRLSAVDVAEMTELVLAAWAMVVPKKVSRERLGGGEGGPVAGDDGVGRGEQQPPGGGQH
jgi:hypothetical protein